MHIREPNKLATDCISRQDAINVLDVLCQEHRYKIPGKRETYSQYNEAWQDALDRAEGAIFNLPSAQPEQIIRCTNCRFFKRNIPCTGGRYNGCEMWLNDGNEIRVMTDDYCSKALPKEGEQE